MPKTIHPLAGAPRFHIHLGAVTLVMPRAAGEWVVKCVNNTERTVKESELSETENNTDSGPDSGPA